MKIMFCGVMVIILVLLSSCSVSETNSTKQKVTEPNTTQAVTTLCMSNSKRMITKKSSKGFELIKASKYRYDINNNIIINKSIEYYGYWDLCERICDDVSPIGECFFYKEKKIKDIIKSYYKASDFLVYNYNGGVAVVKYIGKQENVHIPKFLAGKKVVKISGYITKVYTDAGSYYYYHSPFGSKKIKSIDIPCTVKEIAKGAMLTTNDFDKDTQRKASLEEINVDKENKFYSSINGVLFNKSKELLLCVPDNYLKESIYIPNSVVNVYSICSKNTKKIIISKNVESITIADSFHAFDFSESEWWRGNGYDNEINIEDVIVDKNNKSYFSVDGVLYSKDKKKMVFYPPKKKCIGLKVLKDTEIISDYDGDRLAFLKSIRFEKKIKEINIYFRKENKPLLRQIEGYKGTAAEKYAKENKFKFVALD